MADAYPWGSQAPAARLRKLTGDLTKTTGARAAYLEAHKAKISEFDETERSLRRDISACEAIIDRENREAQSQQLSKLMARIAGGGKVDLGALLSDPDLESKLAQLVVGTSTGDAGGKKAKSKKAEAPTDNVEA